MRAEVPYGSMPIVRDREPFGICMDIIAETLFCDTVGTILLMEGIPKLSNPMHELGNVMFVIMDRVSS